MEDTDWFAERKEKQQERCYWRRVGFIAFAAILVLLFSFLVFPKKVHADALVTKQGDNVVRLIDKQCKNATILEQIRPEYQDKFRAGEAELNGKKYTLCWIAANGSVFMLYEDGDRGQAPMSIFERELGV